MHPTRRFLHLKLSCLLSLVLCAPLAQAKLVEEIIKVPVKAMFATYGETAKTPTLWVYTENDQWMGPKYPKEWFEAYKAKSGSGEFLLLPPTAQTATASSPATPQLGVHRCCSL